MVLLFSSHSRVFFFFFYSIVFTLLEEEEGFCVSIFCCLLFRFFFYARELSSRGPSFLLRKTDRKRETEIDSISSSVHPVSLFSRLRARLKKK